MIDCWKTFFTSYPPNAVAIGTVGVAMGDIKELREPVWTKIASPTGLTPMDFSAKTAMGTKIVMTALFIITCVRIKGTAKNTKPIRYRFPREPTKLER